MNLILERTDQVRYFTNMKDVLAAAGIDARDYEWFISDVETNFTPESFTAVDQWISGERLARLLEHDEIQFIWAVFSAFPKGLRPTISAAPIADGNPDYWNGKNPGTQLADALFEIACWDSSATILVGLPEAAQRSFIARYSDTRPLADAARA